MPRGRDACTWDLPFADPSGQSGNQIVSKPPPFARDDLLEAGSGARRRRRGCRFLTAPEAHEYRLVLLLVVVPLAAHAPTKSVPSKRHPSQSLFHAALTTSPGTCSAWTRRRGVRSLSVRRLWNPRDRLTAEPRPLAALDVRDRCRNRFHSKRAQSISPTKEHPHERCHERCGARRTLDAHPRPSGRRSLECAATNDPANDFRAGGSRGTSHRAGRITARAACRVPPRATSPHRGRRA